jgi:hypothetical protein
MSYLDASMGESKGALQIQQTTRHGMYFLPTVSQFITRVSKPIYSNTQRSRKTIFEQDNFDFLQLLKNEVPNSEPGLDAMPCIIIQTGAEKADSFIRE